MDILFDFISRGDAKCVVVVKWWRESGRGRYPTLALIVRDTLMVMG